MAPGSAHHARVRDHRRRRLHRVSLPHRRPESRPHVDGPGPQPDSDTVLHRQLPVFVSAPGTYADVEPGGGGRLLCRAAAGDLPSAGGAVPATVATAPAVDGPGGAQLDHAGVAGVGAHHRLASRRRTAVAADLLRVVHRRNDAGCPPGEWPPELRAGLPAALAATPVRPRPRLARYRARCRSRTSREPPITSNPITASGMDHPRRVDS